MQNWLGEGQTLKIPSTISRACLGWAFRWDRLALLLDSAGGGVSRKERKVDMWEYSRYRNWGFKWPSRHSVSGTFYSLSQRTSFFSFSVSLLSPFMCFCSSYFLLCILLFFFYFLRLGTSFIFGLSC